jgi:hypothetical protein
MIGRIASGMISMIIFFIIMLIIPLAILPIIVLFCPYPAYPAACDPAYPCSSSLLSLIDLHQFSLTDTLLPL